MRFLALLCAGMLLFGLAAESQAQRVQITYRGAEYGPESPAEEAAHAEGRAADLDEVDRKPVFLAVDPSASPDKREAMRARLREIEASARANKTVELFMSPIGGFQRNPKTKEIIREATQQELDAHKTHVHMTITP